MEKIKNVFASSSSSASAKLSKAFRFNGERNILKRTNTNGLGGGGNPFLDGPVLEEIFFAFLAICTMGAVAGFQAKWFSVSGGTGFVLFLLLLSFLLSAFLMIVPIVYDRWDRLKSPARFLGQTRSTFILHAFGTFLMLLSAFIVTISAWTAKGCKNPDDDPHADLGDDFKNGLKDWCTTKKASAIFDWFAFGAWAALLVLTALVFRRERQQNRRREPAFIPPESNGVSYSNILAADDERYADKGESNSELPASASGYDTPGGYGYARPNQTQTQTAADLAGGALSRPSVDAYGAFDGDMPGAVGGRHGYNSSVSSIPDGGQSRTMQLAYTDPCE
uniref:MARVEL domain-containing protein n=1 Tax=Kwoniella dejecticola CBS 10117 TaxID=1296121 RepID=A0A1A5ZTX2_9TREE|nr:uncharacterized protein I303_08615 [Kwoniella dejecticola CBS 10117]OBR81230.1 hypothetical protein I303_08615 [Kwoniella dejecticola CBS 10117]